MVSLEHQLSNPAGEQHFYQEIEASQSEPPRKCTLYSIYRLRVYTEIKKMVNFSDTNDRPCQLKLGPVEYLIYRRNRIGNKCHSSVVNTNACNWDSQLQTGTVS
jgi:hypothetical protein